MNNYHSMLEKDEHILFEHEFENKEALTIFNNLNPANLRQKLLKYNFFFVVTMLFLILGAVYCIYEGITNFLENTVEAILQFILSACIFAIFIVIAFQYSQIIKEIYGNNKLLLSEASKLYKILRNNYTREEIEHYANHFVITNHRIILQSLANVRKTATSLFMKYAEVLKDIFTIELDISSYRLEKLLKIVIESNKEKIPNHCMMRGYFNSQNHEQAQMMLLKDGCYDLSGEYDLEFEYFGLLGDDVDKVLEILENIIPNLKIIDSR